MGLHEGRADWLRAGKLFPDAAERPAGAGNLKDLIADNAAHHLMRRRPQASAHQRVTPGQATAASLGLTAATAAFLLAPDRTAEAVSVLFAIAFAAMLALRWVALLLPRRFITAAPLHDADLPVYSLLIPLYREAAALPGLVSAIKRIDYPSARLDAKLVIEADDAATLETARALDLDDRFSIVTVPPGKPRTKPKALNYALAFTHGELVAVYDAEDWPHPDQLRRAAAALKRDPSLICVQAPLDCYNASDSFITRGFALEYAIHFHIWLPALTRFGWPAPLGGTSNHFRVEDLRAASGWDPFNVTEDADLGFRLAAQGGRIGMIEPATAEEATRNLKAWTGQRSRWIKGYMQTLLVNTRDARLVRGAGAAGAVSMAATLLIAILSAFAYGPTALFMAGWVGLALAGVLAPPPVWSLTLFALGYLTAFASAAMAARRMKQPVLLRAALWRPFYWALLTPAAIKAFMDLVKRPFHWDKTSHGLSDKRPR